MNDIPNADEARSPVWEILEPEERKEILDWVLSCQSAYAMEKSPQGVFRAVPGQLEENQECLLQYVESVVSKKLEAQKLAMDAVSWQAALAQKKTPRFPAMLRKMWSGAEVQEWLDHNLPAITAEESFAFPRPTRGESSSGWTVSPELVKSLMEIMADKSKFAGFVPTPEETESVLIALEMLINKNLQS